MRSKGSQWHSASRSHTFYTVESTVQGWAGTSNQTGDPDSLAPRLSLPLFQELHRKKKLIDIPVPVTNLFYSVSPFPATSQVGKVMKLLILFSHNQIFAPQKFQVKIVA